MYRPFFPDLYSDQVGHLPSVEQSLKQLQHAVDMETDYMKQMLGVMGTLETLFAASQQNQGAALSGVGDIKNLIPTEQTLDKPS